MTTIGEDILHEAEATCSKLSDAKAMIKKRIIGQDRVVDLTLAAMLSGGHVLLVGVPGLGKTRLVETVSEVMGLSSNRVQFTPDLMPADILGSEILQTDPDGTRRFKFAEGPAFCQLLMADEINRASPRTQSALLQAMQEGTVSIAGEARPLPRPFHVLATQNPIELEGTYPLPEAQLDRFLVRIDIGYPDRDAERDILFATTGVQDQRIEQVLDASELMSAQKLVRRMPIGEAVVEQILDVVRSCRPAAREASARARTAVEWGPGPRAAQSLMLSTRARALLNGRLAPSPDDVSTLAQPVLGHRMSLDFAARSRGEDLQSIIGDAVIRAVGSGNPA